MILLVHWPPCRPKGACFSRCPMSCRFSLILGLVWLLGSAWLSASMLKILAVMLHLFGIVREGASMLVDQKFGVKHVGTTSFHNIAKSFTSPELSSGFTDQDFSACKVYSLAFGAYCRGVLLCASALGLEIFLDFRSRVFLAYPNDPANMSFPLSCVMLFRLRMMVNALFFCDR